MGDLHSFLDRITKLERHSEELHDAFFTEAIEQGGTFEPVGAPVTIALHDVHVIASRLDDAINGWIGTAAFLCDEGR